MQTIAGYVLSAHDDFYQPTPKSVTVNSAYDTTETMTGLPNGDALAAQLVDGGARRVTGLLTRRGSTTLLPETDGAYRHTIDRADATITLVVDSADSHTYVAAVETMGLPAGTAAPTIADATGSGQDHGDIWTTAQSGDTVQVTLHVPEGYQAVVKAVDDGGNAVALDGGGNSLTVPGPETGRVVSFTMPAANVQVTITYEKTQFDLTLRVVDTSGAGNTSAVTPNSIVSGTSSLTTNGQRATVKEPV